MSAVDEGHAVKDAQVPKPKKVRGKKGIPPWEQVPQQTADYTYHKQLLYTAVLFTGARKVLETGTDVGDSTRILATALRETGGELVTVDIKDVPKPWAKDYPNVKFVVSDSLRVQLKEPIDLLYLDSDHSQQHLYTELRNLGKWVRVGGIILIDDTCHSEFGNGIVLAIRRWCHDNALRWTEDPFGNGIGIIEVTHELAK